VDSSCLFLVVCKSCDDLLKAVDAEVRCCECGRVSASMEGEVVAVRDQTGKAVVIQVEWDTMDRLIPSSLFLGTALPRDSERVLWKP
jgi:ssDNA-binding replication factor A large subunit